MGESLSATVQGNSRRLIAPSILSADFGRLADELRAVAAAGADLVHVDVMDGHFVPNITIGPPVVRALRRTTELQLDVHLMIENPERHVPAFLEAGADSITIHCEVVPQPRPLLGRIRQGGARCGLAINPPTPSAVLRDLLPEIDMALVMSVNPGFGGQAFIPSVMAKIGEVRALRDAVAPGCLIEVDGGVKTDNVGQVAAAGADVIVAGSAIFETADYSATIAAFRSAIDRALR